ncbi:hypothetical protein UFOVP826_31 [uncultured Caudovirales phage]|uniref:Uncharacterized protein n=1 Tax=uncultured Caudovirales phage TaxID=2100421 RepID=A0A6J5P5H8_9CAUD|nr:hypothetical protein UFOVP826_31 [uncultured Caudovirales phage]
MRHSQHEDDKSWIIGIAVYTAFAIGVGFLLGWWLT